jgi:site-specific DNA-methyltransferase (cytosine-N4-specific)
MRRVEARLVRKTVEAQDLRRVLAARTENGQTDYWSFRGAVTARHEDDVLFQYPAMMVSPMQGALIDVLREHRDGPLSVLDPFVGSGTTLIEAMRRGLAFVGADLNPFAVMLARVESAEAAAFDIEASLARVLRSFQDARGSVDPPHDEWTQRWFREDVCAELAALRSAIRCEEQPELRRLWWACMAEVCRLSSNARISTPKLQTRPLGDLARSIDVAGRFEQLARRAMAVIIRRGEALKDAGFVTSTGRYQPGVDIQLADARDLPRPVEPADVVLTSPPYGDNHTTMPYGQASFLPLCWIDLADTAVEIPAELLASSRSLDTASLGGSRMTAEIDAVDDVAAQSPALADVLATLARRSHEAWQRVGSFFVDCADAWDSILAATKPDAHLVITLGDRTVRGLHVPTALITQQLLAARGAQLIDTLHRSIPHNKRIARRNEAGSTIGAEVVLVLQRNPRAKCPRCTSSARGRRPLVPVPPNSGPTAPQPAEVRVARSA